MNNWTNFPVDVVLDIDGKYAGLFRVNPMSDTTISRGKFSTRDFVFLASGTKEAEEAQLELNDNLGLISATFKAGKYKEAIRTPSFVENTEDEYESYSVSRAPSDSRSGGTGLGKESKQKFTDAEAIDYTGNEHTIHIRLSKKEKTTYAPLPDPKKTSTAIPPL
jgi:hypothetical protein